MSRSKSSRRGAAKAAFVGEKPRGQFGNGRRQALCPPGMSEQSLTGGDPSVCLRLLTADSPGVQVPVEQAPALCWPSG
jgi:hypothetical protein